MGLTEKQEGNDGSEKRLTKACTGARGVNFIIMASTPRAPGDARR
ncbi:MAG TPA: hypothetical protein VHJ59_08205 [Nitrososphaera sp.]|nr:hypothetical protein [Nitrososphaera sp.]